MEARYYPVGRPSEVQTVTVGASPLKGLVDQSVTVALDDLALDTEYKAQIQALNDEGSTEDSFVTFTTQGGYARTIAGADGTGNDAGWRMLALPAAGKKRAALDGDVDFAARSEEMLYRWDAASQSWTAQTSSSDVLPRGRAGADRAAVAALRGGGPVERGYVYRIQAGDYTETRKLVLVR